MTLVRGRRWRGDARRAVLFVALGMLVWSVACSPEPDPIAVDRDRISVLNRSSAEWRDLELRVNRYYMVKVASLARDGRFDAPIRRLQGGFGRYFDPTREQVRLVQVTATSATR